MKQNKTLGYTFITAVASLIGYIAYYRTNSIAGIFVIFSIAWLLYRFTSYQKIWDTFGFFIDPAMATFLTLLLGTTYYVLEGNFLDISLTFGLGTALLGAALSMWLYKYWTIGD